MEEEKIRIYYQSTVRGVSERELKTEDLIYFGFTTRIPKKDYPDKLEEHMLRQAEDLRKLLKEEILQDGDVFEYLPNGTVERHEVWETGTGDMISIWRVPFRLKAKGKVEK